MEPVPASVLPTPPPTSAVSAADTASSLLSAGGLGLYDQGRWVWRQLGLHIALGERVALTGLSGSGKTALLRALAGLLPVTEGEIAFEGRTLQNWSMPDYRSRVGYLPQRPELGDGDTVEAALSAPFAYRAHRRQQYPEAQMRDALRMIGRDPGFLQRRIESLSGGEQQITALLRLLALQPRLLLLDEPTASLDRLASRGVETLLNAWQDENRSRAWLWISHDAEQAARISDRQIMLGLAP